MNKAIVLFETLPKIVNNDLNNIQNNRKKIFSFQAKKKIFNIQTKIKEDKHSVMIDGYVEWYDIKQKKMRKKRFLHIYDCEDQECDELLW